MLLFVNWKEECCEKHWLCTHASNDGRDDTTGKTNTHEEDPLMIFLLLLLLQQLLAPGNWKCTWFCSSSWAQKHMKNTCSFQQPCLKYSLHSMHVTHNRASFFGTKWGVISFLKPLNTFSRKTRELKKMQQDYFFWRFVDDSLSRNYWSNNGRNDIVTQDFLALC